MFHFLKSKVSTTWLVAQTALPACRQTGLGSSWMTGWKPILPIKKRQSARG